MAIIGVSVSYFAYTSLKKLIGDQKWGLFVNGFVTAWLSIFIASLAAALEIAASGTSPANIAVPAMGGIHALIGIGEGLITVGALTFIYAARRDLLQAGQTAPAGGKAIWLVGLGIAILLTIFSPLASANPDGLEWVAEQKGFLDVAQAPLYKVIPDYVFPGITNESMATIIAGILGTLIVFGVALGVAYMRRSQKA
jgi:cobalt/nickel transport system permease protein